MTSDSLNILPCDQPANVMCCYPYTINNILRYFGVISAVLSAYIHVPAKASYAIAPLRPEYTWNGFDFVVNYYC